MKTLLLDNYDSFTYNLMHYIGEAGGEVEVIRNDAITASEVMAAGYGAIVISPGPGTPDDSGICLELVRQAAGTIPLLGVCLGHQTIGQVFGGKVVRDRPMHGKVSPVAHHGSGVFKGLASPLNATRYHSLVLEPSSLPDCLTVTATSDDGQTIMGVQHQQLNVHGVQFHPESIASEHGHAMIRNFLELAQ